MSDHDERSPDGREDSDDDRSPTPASTISSSDPAGVPAAITPDLISRLASLIEILETELPPGYRSESFRILAPRLIDRRSSGTSPSGATPSAASAAQPRDDAARQRAASAKPGLESARLDLAPYAGLLSGPGNTRLKALAALDVAEAQLGVHWMTPAEVERLLVERAGARSIYRTNLSTALGKARGLVDRRRRGRGYEYRLTALGRDTLHRELTLIGG